MATIVAYNGKSFSIPATGEENWGGSLGVDGFLIELGNNVLQKAGGTFTLAGDVDFGAAAGLEAIYYKSRGTISTAGIVRMASAESIGWRNNANSGNLLLTTDASDNLTFNGHIISSSSGVVPVAAGGTSFSSYTAGDILYASGTTALSKLGIGTANYVLGSSGTAPQWMQIVNASVSGSAAIAYSKLSLTGSIVNADVSGSAAIARSKLASGTASHVIINDGSGVFSSEPQLATTRGGTGLSAAGTVGNVLTSDGTNWTSAAPAAAKTKPDEISNIAVVCSVAGNALTIAAKQADGSSALGSGSSSADVGFRSTTATDGSYSKVNITSITSLVISSGSTLGHSNAIPQYIYVYLINNGGTAELAASSNLFDEGSLQSSTAEGGAGGATSMTTLYSTTARTSKAIRLIARLSSTQTTAGTWAAVPTEVSAVNAFPKRTAPTVTKYTSGSGTYTTPAGVKFLRVKMVGGGGGGGQSGTAGGTAGGNGGDTTFGTSLLTASKGTGGDRGGDGTSGGGFTVSAPAVDFGSCTGGGGGAAGASGTGTTYYVGGGMGGSSFYGGAGASGGYGGTGAGKSGAANTGGGGGGAGTGTTSGILAGSGGSAGGFVDAIIYAPAATYAYAVGAAGSAGLAGTSGLGGGAGAAGIIIVEEFYN